ncbi:MAG: LysR family transcriptional regulator [Epulopiscium sp.]|nr:LysR family transcriptional regulator [Candidatus Epulonipiscium sp.]
MNLSHLRYALEVEKTRSISKAAENLLMGQPNLSRAIKELEESLGITLFNRTSKGISITVQGEEFLMYARKILMQVDEVKSIYENKKNAKQQFSISVPRASYIGTAFTNFIQRINSTDEAKIFYKETNSMKAIDNILKDDYKLAIIRYQINFEKYYHRMLYKHNLSSETIMQFSNFLLMSKDNSLAKKENIEASDLSQCIEIAHSDPYIPSLSPIDARKSEHFSCSNKRIFIFERAIQFDLLSNIKNSFMWATPIPEHILKLHHLVQKSCNFNKKKYKDVLIYRNDYHLTELDKSFIDEINKIKKRIL